MSDPLEAARKYAQAGRWDECVACCESLTNTSAPKIELLLEVGSLLLDYGFIEKAKRCFDAARQLDPADLRSQINLAKLLLETGKSKEANVSFRHLFSKTPSAVLFRNLLTSQQYDPDAGNNERLETAKEWGRWAIEKAGGLRQRPRFKQNREVPLRVGYVSADFCQHTVGRLVKPVISAHDRKRIEAFAYSSGEVEDILTREIARSCNFRKVKQLDDAALAALIRQDNIDVLIDLSGQTAGSRLSVFAYRAAPVQLSWLGYFATTGMPTIDAVLLDEWHAPPGIEAQFVEPIIRLSSGRFCYEPPRWAPATIAASPLHKNGYVTFGCFNNTAKLGPAVFDVWARILACADGSRLVLKWKTFNDDAFRRQVSDEFSRRGISPARIELRNQSFHVALLNEYNDIDIALDPFPFTGGMTSFECLWMGVPIVTWPQERVVSRQTHAILSSMALEGFSAVDADDYVKIALSLASDVDRLDAFRGSIREKMQASVVLDLPAFTRGFEDSLIDVYDSIRESEEKMTRKMVLHVGCGHIKSGAELPEAFKDPEWHEIRLDIDPANKPDIVGSMLGMPDVADCSMDAVYSSHNIEHVYAHEVQQVLSEFLRVLKPGGYAVLTCPDLQSVCALVAEDRLNDTVYQSPAGPITPLDILYGHGTALASGNHYMAHKCGFTFKTLTEALDRAGFGTIAGKRRLRGLDLWVIATKQPMEDKLVRELAERILPV